MRLYNSYIIMHLQCLAGLRCGLFGLLLCFFSLLEFQTSLQSDADRVQRLLCSIANPEHPYSTFVWGAQPSTAMSRAL